MKDDFFEDWKKFASDVDNAYKKLSNTINITIENANKVVKGSKKLVRGIEKILR